MSKLVDQLAKYASYHRDRRNILTHFLGIPLIVQSVTVLLARPTLPLTDEISLSAGMVLAALASLFYLALDRRIGAVMTALLALSVSLSSLTTPLATSTWLCLGLGMFVLGWVIQFWGHYYEGRKPAFVDDIIGLLIGPMFVVAELGFLLGLRKDLEGAVISKVGTTR